MTTLPLALALVGVAVGASRESTPAKLPLYPNPGPVTGLRKVGDMWLRDTSICLGPDGTWYMTGTSAPKGIDVWKSKDMLNWTPLGTVWSYGGSPWHKRFADANRPLWAPEIHYFKNTFWLTYSMPDWDASGKVTSGCGVLKSTTGKAEGPYVDMHPDGPLGDEIDASLFQDDDGKVYFVWHSGKIALMKDDMTGFAAPYHWIRTSVADTNPAHHSGLCEKIFGKGSYDHVGYEGATLFKRRGIYYLACSENFDGRYSCAIAQAKHVFGPYGPRYEAIPHGGHNVFFQDERGDWWSTYFGSDPTAPWQEKPGVLPVHFDRSGRLLPGK
jgi:beta-xylosidase